VNHIRYAALKSAARFVGSTMRRSRRKLLNPKEVVGRVDLNHRPSGLEPQEQKSKLLNWLEFPRATLSLIAPRFALRLAMAGSRLASQQMIAGACNRSKLPV
jgi:hypothetical protein